MTDEDQTWRVGDLARETGITVRALHHYDRLGLLSPSSRTQGGQRCYTSEDLRRLHHLIALRSFGLSLKEIKSVLDADVHPDPADLLRRHLAALDERIRKSIDLRGRLLAVLDALDGSLEERAAMHERREHALAALDPGARASLCAQRRLMAPRFADEREGADSRAV